MRKDRPWMLTVVWRAGDGSAAWTGRAARSARAVAKRHENSARRMRAKPTYIGNSPTILLGDPHRLALLRQIDVYSDGDGRYPCLNGRTFDRSRAVPKPPIEMAVVMTVQVLSVCDSVMPPSLPTTQKPPSFIQEQIIAP